MREADITLSLPGVAATRRFAGRLIPLLCPGICIGLSGELGAGKTEFVRQLVTELGGSAAAVCSPTYVLESVYAIDPEKALVPEITIVRHWDLYRLSSGAAPGELFDDAGFPSGITLVEWPERSVEWGAVEDLRLQFLLPDHVLAASELQETDSRQVRVFARSTETAGRLRVIFGSE